MSKIYAWIENLVNNMLKIALVDDMTGEVTYGNYIKGPKWVGMIVQLISSILLLILIGVVGLYLWNNGLHPVFPGIVAPINGTNPLQAHNPYVQLVITLIALLVFF